VTPGFGAAAFPERLSGKEALGIVWRVCRQKGLWTGVLKTYCCVRLGEEMRRWAGRNAAPQPEERRTPSSATGLPQIPVGGVMGLVSVALFASAANSRR
jgi:hypothetical protein